jgi:cytochrome c556
MKSALAFVLSAAVLSAGVFALPSAHADDVGAVLEKREGLMKAQRGHLGALAGFAKGETSPADPAAFLAEHASGLINTAQAIPSVFPAGAVGKAKPAVWENWADFEAKAKGLEGAAANLLKLAQAGDFDGAKKAVGGIGAACQACHSVYRN